MGSHYTFMEFSGSEIHRWRPIAIYDSSKKLYESSKYAHGNCCICGTEGHTFLYRYYENDGEEKTGYAHFRCVAPSRIHNPNLR